MYKHTFPDFQMLGKMKTPSRQKTGERNNLLTSIQKIKQEAHTFQAV